MAKSTKRSGAHLRGKPVLAALPVAILVSLANTTVSAAATPKIVVVFDVQATGVKLKASFLKTLPAYIATRLVESGLYSVVPRDQLQKRLGKERKKSYKRCYDKSCQIEIGRQLAAQYTLATQVMKLGKRCVFTLNLFDLRKSTAERAATAHGACSSDALVAVLDKALAKLLDKGKTSAGESARKGPARDKVLFSDELVDNRHGWPLWPKGKNWISYIRAGSYWIYTKNTKCSQALITLPDALPANYDLEAETIWGSGAKAYGYGVALGSSKTTFYGFMVTGNGQAAVWTNIDNQVAPDVLAWVAGKARPGDGRAVNRLKIEVRGKTVRYFINGKFITRFQSRLDLTRGHVGFRSCNRQLTGLRSLRIVAR